MSGRPGSSGFLVSEWRLLSKRAITLKSAPGTGSDGSITGPPLKRSSRLPAFMPQSVSASFEYTTCSIASPP